MKKIDLTLGTVRNACVSQRNAGALTVLYGREGGGVSIPQAAGASERYLLGDITLMEEHCAAFLLSFFARGEMEARLYFRFGLLPGVKTRVRFDLSLMDNSTIYTVRTPGLLKMVCHGKRISMEECERVELGVEDAFHPIRAELSGFCLDDSEPQDFPLPNERLVDKYGQWKKRDWPGKIHTDQELERAVRANEGACEYPFHQWDKWGGYLGHKLGEGKGFFSSVRKEGRWYLADPDGYSFFSNGVCGAGSLVPTDRVDMVEQFCDWIPERGGEYEELFRETTSRRTPWMPPEHSVEFSFAGANLRRVYGKDFRERWRENYRHILTARGLNTTGSFPELPFGASARELARLPEVKIPYVQQIGYAFPDTEHRIFRDFPDVMSPEYRKSAESFAQELVPYREDPWMVGYFMRNEPEFNFVKNLVVADEVLYNPRPTACRAALKDWLAERYGEISRLNRVWGTEFPSFSVFDSVVKNASAISPEAQRDLREFSVILVREYVRVPAEACRRADPHHLNLGLRWSKADNLDMCAGWEYCDVFSMNCYSFDPTEDMDFVKNAGVDRPILIGEFHFGALDRGLPATGLKGVENQEERARAWRMFCERTAEHPCGVGVHWFQFHDQFCLGRQDGENYQIGIVDMATRPYPELTSAMEETARELYEIQRGAKKARVQQVRAIPMIGY